MLQSPYYVIHSECDIPHNEMNSLYDEFIPYCYYYIMWYTYYTINSWWDEFFMCWIHSMLGLTYRVVNHLGIYLSIYSLDHGQVRSSRPDVFCKKIFLEILQNSQENTCEFCEISNNTFSYKQLWWLLLDK